MCWGGAGGEHHSSHQPRESCPRPGADPVLPLCRSCLSKEPRASVMSGVGKRGRYPGEKLEGARLVTTEVRAHAFDITHQRSMGHRTRIPGSCVITCHPGHGYHMCAGPGVWPCPMLPHCSGPAVSACPLPYPSSAPRPRAPFSNDTGRARNISSCLPPHSFLPSTYYVSNTGEWGKNREGVAPPLNASG